MLCGELDQFQPFLHRSAEWEIKMEKFLEDLSQLEDCNRLLLEPVREAQSVLMASITKYKQFLQLGLEFFITRSW